MIDMKWNKYTITTVTGAEDIISATLADIGICGVEIEDKVPLSMDDKEQMFIDILPELPPDDKVAHLTFYLEPEEDNAAILARVREELDALRAFTDIGAGSIRASETLDKDWINNWKEYFHQFYVDDILVIPSWEQVKEADKDKMIIHIDPGTAFGTGMHETTQLAIRQLSRYVTKDTRLLDVGTGSGILSIVAIKRGARYALGTDLDPCAKAAVAENIQVNGIDPADFRMVIGNIIDDEAVQRQAGYEAFDIVTANILADVLLPLTPVVYRHIKKGGIYITSGILDEKEEEVKAAVLAAGFEVAEITHQNEWVSITARKA